VIRFVQFGAFNSFQASPKCFNCSTYLFPVFTFVFKKSLCAVFSIQN
jgi:hypothetical protein